MDYGDALGNSNQEVRRGHDLMIADTAVSTMGELILIPPGFWGSWSGGLEERAGSCPLAPA